MHTNLLSFELDLNSTSRDMFCQYFVLSRDGMKYIMGKIELYFGIYLPKDGF